MMLFLYLLVMFFVIVGYFLDYKKRGLLYSIIIGVMIGIIAYNYVPPENYDLYRHHLVVQSLMNHDFAFFLKFFSYSDMDLIPYFYSYFISIIGNVNLQQFFVVSMGYTILLWIFQDIRKSNNISNIIFCIILLFTLFGFMH